MEIRFGSHHGPPLTSCQFGVEALKTMLLQNHPCWLRQLASELDSWCDLEREIDQQVRERTGGFLAALLQEASQESAFVDAREEVERQAAVPIKSPEPRPSQIRMLCGGLVLYVTTLYCPLRPASHKNTSQDEDQEQRAGLFPELAAFGITLGCTPAMMETVARIVVRIPDFFLGFSLDELAEQLPIPKESVNPAKTEAPAVTSRPDLEDVFWVFPHYRCLVHFAHPTNIVRIMPTWNQIWGNGLVCIFAQKILSKDRFTSRRTRGLQNVGCLPSTSRQGPSRYRLARFKTSKRFRFRMSIWAPVTEGADPWNPDWALLSISSRTIHKESRIPITAKNRDWSLSAITG